MNVVFSLQNTEKNPWTKPQRKRTVQKQLTQHVHTYVADYWLLSDDSRSTQWHSKRDCTTCQELGRTACMVGGGGGSFWNFWLGLPTGSPNPDPVSVQNM